MKEIKDILEILNPQQLDRFEIIKDKLKRVLLLKRYCSFCIEYYDVMLTVDTVFELSAVRQKVSIKNMVENLFNDASILTSDYVCKICVDQLIRSYMFIATTKFAAKVLDIYVTELTDKVNICDLKSVEHVDNSIAMILDQSTLEKYFPEKIKIKKSVEAKEENLYKCSTCSIVFQNHKEFSKHKKTHLKSEYECSLCCKTFKNDVSLSIHYTTHKVIKCKLCSDLMPEKDLSNHLKTEHKNTALECHQCSVAFYNNRALETHIHVSHTKSKSNHKQCPMCLKHFTDINAHQCRFTCSQCKDVKCRHYEYLMSYRDQTVKGKRVECPQCDYVTSTRETFLGHVNKVHLKYRPFACEQCTLKFHSKINLQAHITRVHKEHYVCGYCDKQFKEKKELEPHIKYCQLIKREFACEKCLASFSTYGEIYSHTKLRHSGSYQCQMCSKEFLSKSRLDLHVEKLHSSVIITSQENNSESNSQQEKQKLEQYCICETCGKSFSSTDALNSHRKIHEEKVPCPECNKMFYPKRLNMHRKQHLADKDPVLKEKLKKKAKIKCSQCEYVTYGKIPLEAHINRYHKKIRPYACSVCNKEFMGLIHLRRHMQCHSGEKSRKCELCPKVLANYNCFIMHMRLHTGEKPNVCDICGERFRSSSIMNVHKTRMHAEKSSECPLCGNMFYNVRELRTHIKKVHWKQKDKKFNYKELEGLKEEHYYLFYDNRLPNLKD